MIRSACCPDPTTCPEAARRSCFWCFLSDERCQTSRRIRRAIEHQGPGGGASSTMVSEYTSVNQPGALPEDCSYMRDIVKRVGVILAVLAFVAPLAAFAQTAHDHVLPVNAVAGGLPYFCEEPTAVAVTSGRWSNPATWATNAVPGRDAKVLIASGREITYDVESDATLRCIELHGRLAFGTDVNTRMKIVHLVVMADGVLEVGTADRAVDSKVTASIEVAD